jgi:hypothetical protein
MRENFNFSSAIVERSTHFSERFRRDGEHGFEHARKMKRIREAEIGGDVFHQRAGVRQLVGGGVHFESQQKLIWRWQRRF